MNNDFSELTATPIAPDIVMPEGLAADVEYVFSVTYTMQIVSIFILILWLE